MKNEYKLDDFKISKHLGTGAFGEVMLVKRKSDNQTFALKRLDKKFIEKVTYQYEF